MEVSSSSLVLITSDHGPSVVLNVYFNGTAFNFSKSEKQREKKKKRKCSEKVDNRRWKKKNKTEKRKKLFFRNEFYLFV